MLNNSPCVRRLSDLGSSQNNPARRDEPPTYKFTLLEALSATGLRAIRYAKEIPLLR